ncbi:MAG: helix-turn-helix transcriptional regulator [Pseudomonadota bacterium]
MISSFFIASALLISLLAFLFGDPKKIFGAGLVLASILFSNIVIRLYKFVILDELHTALVYLSVDALIVMILFSVFRHRSEVTTSRWAIIVAGLHLAMIGVHLLFVIKLTEISLLSYVVSLNALLSLALAVLFICFLPRNLDEAYSIINVKLFYLKLDISRILKGRFRRQGVLRLAFVSTDEAKAIQKLIGRRLRLARIQKHLTCSDVAKAMNVEQSTISRIENGERRINAADLVVLSRYYGVDMQFFIGGIDSGMKTAKPIGPS